MGKTFGRINIKELTVKEGFGEGVCGIETKIIVDI